LRRNILYQSLARDHDKKSKDPNWSSLIAN
jgi:hypothetical protein